MKHRSGLLISFFFVFLNSFLQTGCFINTMGLAPEPCPVSPTYPPDPYFNGCFQTAISSEEDFFLRIELNDNCPSQLTGEGYGVISVHPHMFTFTGNVQGYGLATIWARVRANMPHAASTSVWSEHPMEAQHVAEGLNITFLMSRFDYVGSLTGDTDWQVDGRSYVLDKIPCPETEGE